MQTELDNKSVRILNRLASYLKDKEITDLELFFDERIEAIRQKEDSKHRF